MAKLSWTDERIERFRLLWVSPSPIEEVAAEMGLGVASARSKAVELMFGRRPAAAAKKRPSKVERIQRNVEQAFARCFPVPAAAVPAAPILPAPEPVHADRANRAAPAPAAVGEDAAWRHPTPIGRTAPPPPIENDAPDEIDVAARRLLAIARRASPNGLATRPRPAEATCLWPVDGGTDGSRTCGEPVTAHRSCYCEAHRGQAFVRTSPMRLVVPR